MTSTNKEGQTSPQTTTPTPSSLRRAIFTTNLPELNQFTSLSDCEVSEKWETDNLNSSSVICVAFARIHTSPTAILNKILNVKDEGEEGSLLSSSLARSVKDDGPLSIKNEGTNNRRASSNERKGGTNNSGGSGSNKNDDRFSGRLSSTNERKSSNKTNNKNNKSSPNTRLQRFVVLNPLEFNLVNELREDEDLPPFPPESVVIEFYPPQERKLEALGFSSRDEEIGFFVLTPTEFEQTDVTLTVRLVVTEEVSQLSFTNFH
jgi:hypothetical protein